jgi:glycosyltransferase involved in cell wall biosynthesis
MTGDFQKLHMASSRKNRRVPKVLLVGPSLSGGGAEGRFSNIARHLFGGKSDVAVLVLHGGIDQRNEGEIISLGWSSRRSYPKAIWLLRRRIRRERYDVVMAFGLFPCVVSILAAAIGRGRTKIVVSEITRPKMEALNGVGWRALAYNLLRKMLYGRCNLITANSIDGLGETCALAGMPIEQGVRVVNVLDLARLTRKAIEASSVPVPEGSYVICIGRLDFMKRIDTVVDAFGLMSGRIQCKLVVVGDGEAREELENKVRVLEMQDSVIFTGMLENPFPLLRHAMAFVLASEYEGYSNSVLEAMFLDVPVITSFCSSDAHEMCDQNAALGFKVGHVEQLAAHIASVVTEQELRRVLVEQARVYRSPHAMDRAIPLYEDLICRVAAETVVPCGAVDK